MEEITRRLDALMGREQWEEAEALLLDALARARETGDCRRELSLCSELLGFYRMRRREDGFTPVWERTLALLHQVRVDARTRGTVLINGATGLVSFGRAAQALPIYREAESCYRRGLGANDPLFAALWNNMSAALESLGDEQGAEERLLRALDIVRRQPHHPDTAISYVNLAQHYARRGDPRWEACLDRAMETLDDPEMLWDGYYAHTVKKCAGAFAALGQTGREKELLERAEIIYEGT